MPYRRRETLLDCGGPQHQDVDAGVGHAVVTQRPRNPPVGIRRIPGFEPWPHAVFEVATIFAVTRVYTSCLSVFMIGWLLFLRPGYFRTAESQRTGRQKGRPSPEGNSQRGSANARMERAVPLTGAPADGQDRGRWFGSTGEGQGQQEKTRAEDRTAGERDAPSNASGPNSAHPTVSAWYKGHCADVA